MMTSDPIFKSIFGNQWDKLPPVMLKHYANRPFSGDVVTAEGKMEVKLSPFMRLLSPLLILTGALVPYEGKDIPVTVHFRSEPDSRIFIFDRIFRFQGRSPYHFRSRMEPAGKDEMTEFMRIGIGWKARYYYDGGKVILAHRGYAARCFGKIIKLPLELLMGSGYAEEEAISENSFRMYMDIRHPLLGTMYVYKGEFTITEVKLDR